MQTEVIFSGFGGQGALFAGQVLAFAAMDAGHAVTWMPSYGPEMRGGTANCTVVIADEEIGSPTIKNPKAAVVMNLPSLDKFEPHIVPGGVLIVNSSLVNRDPVRTDITWVMIPAQEIAETIGPRRLLNMVMLGALIEKLPILTVDDLKEALSHHLPERHKKLLPSNLSALERGAAFARGEFTIEKAVSSSQEPVETIAPTSV
ncbi:MAG: 2-oxoacid:ferredoxin oxidoreductase subunit gamma [Anaerolineales bacterium]|nr:2-oxoacid:ferredoxin oxidoreductase subunit gamma [Anaerolineae bacterium]PWB54903.1 MAG: 2-oxoacid:ferredoxin oxidoreductase subunit gamma [Anaerolineales bacterium]